MTISGFSDVHPKSHPAAFATLAHRAPVPATGCPGYQPGDSRMQKQRQKQSTTYLFVTIGSLTRDGGRVTKTGLSTP